MRSNHRAGGYHASIADPYAGKYKARLSDPYIIPDTDRPDIIVGRRSAGHALFRVHRMPIGIEHPNVAGKSALATDRNALPDDERAAVADSRLIANLKDWLVTKPRGKCDADLAVQSHVIAKDDTALALDPMEEAASMHSLTVLCAVCLEKRFADKDPKQIVVGRPTDQKYP